MEAVVSNHAKALQQLRAALTDLGLDASLFSDEELEAALEDVAAAHAMFGSVNAGRSDEQVLSQATIVATETR
jgi:hypothetical protein